ncbi:MAG: glycosyltransferase [Rikenellaceae bacterium]|nr:glycosyltransferase [Rikenellaceae bacterium]
MMNFFDVICAAYGWQGLALMAVIVALWAVQIYFYAVRYRRLPKYTNNALPELLTDEPPVSVVIVTQEDIDFVEQRLPKYLTQDYHTYEVVLVYVGNNEDFSILLTQMRLKYPHLKITNIKQNTRFPISNKQALNFGIRAAAFDHILLSTSDTIVPSERWIRLMAKGFTRGNVVLGYCGVELRSGFAGRLMRTQRMAESMTWLSAAIAGKPYRGVRNTLGITRDLYLRVKGFNHLNMNMGEDDLFLQSLADEATFSIIISPRATVRQKVWGGASWWLGARKYFGHTYRFYPLAARNAIEWEGGSRVLFFLASMAALIALPVELKIATAVIVLLRYVLVYSTVNAVRKRLGEKHIMATYFLYDLFGVWVDIALAASRRIYKDDTVWR